MVVTLHEPLAVVALDEGSDLALGVGEIGATVQPQALLLQRPHEALDHAVALRLAHERRGVLKAAPAQPRPKGVGRVLRAPVGAARSGRAPRPCRAGRRHTARPGRAARAPPTDRPAWSPSSPPARRSRDRSTRRTSTSRRA